MSIASYAVVPSAGRWESRRYVVTGRASADSRRSNEHSGVFRQVKVDTDQLSRGAAGARPFRQRHRGVYVRRRVAVAVMALGLLTLVRPAGAAISGMPGGSADVPAPVRVQRYVVAPGDSYWSIAGALAPESDRRSVVYDLREARDDRPLIPGEVIEWVGH